MARSRHIAILLCLSSATLTARAQEPRSPAPPSVEERATGYLSERGIAPGTHIETEVVPV